MEKFIEKCLKSCVSQDLSCSDYEIIVVNDSTPDNSINIVDKFIQKKHQNGENCNIHVICRPNGGLSAARNTGLKEAKGDYIWFVDSDDWIEPNVLKSLIVYIEKYNLDVLCFNLQLVFDNGHIEPYIIKHPNVEKIYDGNDFICKVNMPPAAVCAIYRRKYLIDNDFSFLEGILHEDMEFTPRVYCKAKRIAYIDKVVYNYFQRIGSIMKSVQHVRRCRDLLTICDKLYEFANRYLEKDTDAYKCMMSKIAFCFSQSVYYYSKDAFSINEYKKRTYYPLWISPKHSLFRRLKYGLLNLNIPLYLLFLRKHL